MIEIDLKPSHQVIQFNHTDEFLLAMGALGNHDMTLVYSRPGVDPDDESVRTAHRDTPLPRHRDGIYTESIAKMQGGTYVERPNTDVVGMYCIKDNTDDDGNHLPCWTILAETEDGPELDRVDLRPGEALIWDNRLWHGREGNVGKRVLIRFWSGPVPALYEVRP